MITNFHEEIGCIIEDCINEISQKKNIKPLCGGIVNSRGKHLNNETSDYDFHFVYEDKNNLQNVVGKLYHKILLPSINEIEIVGFKLDWVLLDNIDYRYNNPIIPSYYTRRDSLILERHAIIYKILASDYQWNESYIKLNRQWLEDYFIDNLRLMDWFYLRAMQMFTHMKRVVHVKVRNYLYVLHDIFSMFWIMEKNHYGPYKFSLLMDGVDSIPKEIVDTINYLKEIINVKYQKIEKNQQSLATKVKTKDYIIIDAIPLLDEYINTSLKKCELWLVNNK